MRQLYSIKNLRCGYSSETTVLSAQELSIAAGRLVFIVGVSGGGKSTLLETLGMMNRTIQASSKVHFYAEDEAAPTNLAGLWAGPNEVLDDFRKRHFSFLFQKTNLIPNFSCGENMLLPALFKGKDADAARTQVQAYMERLGLPPQTFDQQISNVSGGQRQRLAFIRAMVADFTVLFGDEPTGNLDPNTAREVMTVLSEHLRTHGKTGIVVSHDIALADAFADEIIPITMSRTEDQAHGVILSENILRRHPESGHWYDAGTDYESAAAHLKKLIS